VPQCGDRAKQDTTCKSCSALHHVQHVILDIQLSVQSCTSEGRAYNITYSVGCIGCRKQLFSAYVFALVLRNLLNSTLPIEAVYNGPGRGDTGWYSTYRLVAGYVQSGFDAGNSQWL
jgi:hypothetical protein